MKLYKVIDLVPLLNSSKRGVRELITSGKLKASKVGRSFIIQEVDLIDYLNNNTYTYTPRRDKGKKKKKKNQ